MRMTPSEVILLKQLNNMTKFQHTIPVDIFMGSNTVLNIFLIVYSYDKMLKINKCFEQHSTEASLAQLVENRSVEASLLSW